MRHFYRISFGFRHFGLLLIGLIILSILPISSALPSAIPTASLNEDAKDELVATLGSRLEHFPNSVYLAKRAKPIPGIKPSSGFSSTSNLSHSIHSSTITDTAKPTSTTTDAHLLYHRTKASALTELTNLQVHHNRTSNNPILVQPIDISKRDVAIKETTHDLVQRARPRTVNPANLPPSSAFGFGSQFGNWRTSYDKGVALWKYLQGNLTTLADSKPAESRCGWSNKGKATPAFTKRFSSSCDDGFLSSIDKVENSADRTRAICQDTYVQFQLTRRLGCIRFLWDRPFYSNWLSLQARTIVAAISWFDGPKNFLKQPPALDKWVDLTFASWQKLAQNKGELPSALKSVISLSVWDDVSLSSVIDIINYNIIVAPWVDAERFLVYTAANPDFYALLGTLDGAYAASLLTKYASHFATREAGDPDRAVTKVKTISKIYLGFRRVGFSRIAFVFDDVNPPRSFASPGSSLLPSSRKPTPSQSTIASPRPRRTTKPSQRSRKPGRTGKVRNHSKTPASRAKPTPTSTRPSPNEA